MKPLYTQLEFERAKSNDELICECYNCNNSFKKKKKYINLVLSNYVNEQGIEFNKSCKFCCMSCKNEYGSKLHSEIVSCKNCHTEYKKLNSEIKKYPNHFCSNSCAATYNNTHKTHGNKRSKLEKYLEEQLISLYPNLQFDFNKKDTINSELDIYIPLFKLAFELNGIFHYEPIFGPEKLSQIQNNDQRKFQACIENNIELVLIDSSSMKNFKKERADNFLNIISNIINQKII